MRIPLIAGNWKMYKTVTEAVKYVKEFRDLVKGIADVEIVLAPTFTAIYGAAAAPVDVLLQPVRRPALRRQPNPPRCLCKSRQ